MAWPTQLRSAWAWIWPQSETDAELNPPAVFKRYADALAAIRKSTDTTLVTTISDLSKDLFDETRDRRVHVENRAAAAVTISGIGLAALGGLSTLLGQVSARLYGWLAVGTLIFIFMSLAYLLGAMLAALRVYGEIRRSTLDPADVVPLQREGLNAYLLRVSAQRIEYAILNYRANNTAVGFVFAAQRRLRHGMVLLALAGSIVVLGQGLTPAGTRVTTLSVTAPTGELNAASQPGAGHSAASGSAVQLQAPSAPTPHLAASAASVQPGHAAPLSSGQSQKAPATGNAILPKSAASAP